MQLGDDFGQVRLELLAGLLGDGAEAEGGALLRVPNGVVIGQVHELVDQVRLVQVGGQRAQLAVRRQLAPVPAAAIETRKTSSRSWNASYVSLDKAR